jgi:hypothetical protein
MAAVHLLQSGWVVRPESSDELEIANIRAHERWRRLRDDVATARREVGA